MSALLFSLWLTVVPASAGDDEPVLTAAQKEEAAQSEYMRLREELDSLAKRTAWPGVERTFQEMLATGVDPTYEDLRVGASAAQALGDLSTAHDRLNQAYSLKESKDVLDWMWSIRETYGSVELSGDPGKVELSAASMPFDPVQAKSVAFAISQVAETGSFVGLLPKGSYRFDDVDFKVASFIDKRVIDLSSKDSDRKSKRKRGK